MTDSTKWDKVIPTLMWMSKKYEDAPSWAMTLKLMEEVGEFSEIMLHEHGFLHHKNKEWKDTPIEEAADIINTVLGALSKHYPDKTPDQISEELHSAFIKKGKKYANILGAEDVFT